MFVEKWKKSRLWFFSYRPSSLRYSDFLFWRNYEKVLNTMSCIIQISHDIICVTPARLHVLVLLTHDFFLVLNHYRPEAWSILLLWVCERFRLLPIIIESCKVLIGSQLFGAWFQHYSWSCCVVSLFTCP